VDRVSDEQLKLSDKGEKDIGRYHPTLTTVFDELDEDELKTCTDMAVEWNTKPLLDEIQRKEYFTLPHTFPWTP
jgi:hypothetical protein